MCRIFCLGFLILSDFIILSRDLNHRSRVTPLMKRALYPQATTAGLNSRRKVAYIFKCIEFSLTKFFSILFRYDDAFCRSFRQLHFQFRLNSSHNKKYCILSDTPLNEKSCTDSLKTIFVQGLATHIKKYFTKRPNKQQNVSV